MINPGEQSTDFYMSDTLMGIATVSVERSLGGWGVAYQTYTVTAAPPSVLEFVSVPRKLISGTTVQYEVISNNGTPSDPADDVRSQVLTPITVQMRDTYGNIAPAVSAVTVVFESTSSITAFGGIDPAADFSGVSWKELDKNISDANKPQLVISAGNNSGSVYIWDTAVGKISIRAKAYELVSASQDQWVTPGIPRYFTIHHPFTNTNPLKVGNIGVATVTVRDAFGNVASGDPDNGQYFTGPVLFNHSGTTTTVSLTNIDGNAPNTVGATFYTFTAANQGVYPSLQIIDSIQESLKINATAYATIDLPRADGNCIYGFTDDANRPFPVPLKSGSDGDIVVAGLVVVPQDWSPEPENPDDSTVNEVKQNQVYVASVYQGRTRLFQGDGLTNETPYSIPMLRLAMVAKPANIGLSGRLSELKVEKLGSLDAGDVVEVALHFDENDDGTFTAESSLGGTPEDVKIATGVWSVAENAWVFTSLETIDPARTMLSDAEKRYFLTVRISSTAKTPRSLGFQLTSPSNIKMTGDSNVDVAENYFSIKTATSPVERAPAEIYVKYDASSSTENIGGWFKGAGDSYGIKHSTVPQGQARVGMIRLAMWTQELTAVLGQIEVAKTGSGSDLHIKSVRLFLDQESGGGPEAVHAGSRLFEPNIDREITDSDTPAVFTDGSAVLDITDKVNNGLIETSTRYFFIVYEFNNSAQIGLTHGVSVADTKISASEGKVRSHDLFQSDELTVVATVDEVRIRDLNRLKPPAYFSVAASTVQGSLDIVVAKFTMGTQQRTAIWQGLKLDRWSPVDQGGAKYNKAQDVLGIKIYYDVDDDDLFDKSADQLIINANNTYRFPLDSLSRAHTSTETVIYVNNIGAFFPDDDIFVSTEPGRLVLGDDQADPSLKEIIYYASVDFDNKAFTGVARGVENTTALDWPRLAGLSGQARIKIEGMQSGLGGEELDTSDKNYFVTYDVDYLANVYSEARLGMEVRTTDYFKFISPDWLSPDDVRRTSYIQQIKEYADDMIVIGTDTTPTLGLVQGATNQVMATLQISASHADIVWRGLVVYATGTAANDGNVADEVTQVTVWADSTTAGNTGELDSNDMAVGAGYFGTGGQPLQAPVKFDADKYQAIVTGPRIFFLTYDIKDDAETLDPATKQARTIGAILREESFPQYANDVDDAVDDWISEPNVVSSATLPFITGIHNIKASPRDIAVLTEPMYAISFSTINKPAMYLTLARSSTTDSIALNSAIDLPNTEDCASAPSDCYVMIGEEILLYTARNVDTLLNVSRGQLGSNAMAHSAGDLLGVPITQGQTNLNVMRLKIKSSGYKVPWEQLRIVRTKPARLNGDDADIKTIKLYQDDGDGVLNRTVSGSVAPFTDILIGQAQFGVGDNPGFTTISISDEDGNPFSLITTKEATYFVAIDIDPAAEFCHPDNTILNEVFGIKLDDMLFDGDHRETFVDADDVQIIPEGPVMPIVATTDDLLAGFKDAAPSIAKQMTDNVILAQLPLRAQANTVILKSLKIKLTGTGVDSDVPVIKIWRDDGNKTFGVEDTTQTADGKYPYLVTPGSFFFSERESELTFTPELVVGTYHMDAELDESVILYLTYDISEFAQVGKTVGVEITSATSFVQRIPDNVIMDAEFYPNINFPFITNTVEVIETESQVSMGVYDAAYELVLQGGVSQAQAGATFLRFNLKTDVANAIWESLLIERTGASADALFSYARNTDVRFVKLYKDVNASDTLDSSDELISSTNTTTMVAIATATGYDNTITCTGGAAADYCAGFDLVPTSTESWPMRGYVFVNDVELMKFDNRTETRIANQCSDDGLYQGMGTLCITSRGELLGDANTPIIAHSSGTDIVKVDVFNQADGNDRTRQIELPKSQILSPVAQTFFIAYDIGEGADIKDTIGVKVAGVDSVGIPSPNNTSATLFENVSRAFPEGTSTDEFPFETAMVLIRPITLSISGFSVSPAGAKPNTDNIPFLQMEIWVDTNYTDVGAFVLDQIGTVDGPATTAQVGQGDVKSVAIYLDSDDNGTFTPDGDTEIGRQTHIGYTRPDQQTETSSDFSNGQALVLLNVDSRPRLRITPEKQTIFVVADISDADVDGNSTIGHSAGFNLRSFNDIKTPQNTGMVKAVPSDISTESPPIQSAAAAITSDIIPATRLIPKIVYSTAAGTSYAYPMFAQLDQNGDVIRNANGVALGDATSVTTVNGEPLIDLDDDGIYDNMDINEDGRKAEIDIDGDGIPEMDIDGDGVLDIDFNDDEIPDTVDVIGGQPRVFLQTLQGSRIPLPDYSFAKTSWGKDQTALYAYWVRVSTNTSLNQYQVAVGRSFSAPTGLRNWEPSSPPTLNSKTLKNLTLAPSIATRLTSNIDTSDTTIRVESTDGFLDDDVVLYVGSEILMARKSGSDTFLISSDVQNICEGRLCRGVLGSAPQNHLSGEVMTNAAYLFSVRGMLNTSEYVPSASGRPFLMYRIDSSPPSVPGQPQSQITDASAQSGSFNITWEASVDAQSRVYLYELQEQIDNDGVWDTIAVIPARKLGGAINNFKIVGNPDEPGESSREPGHYYAYRARAFNKAGMVTAWSDESDPACLGDCADIPNTMQMGVYDMALGKVVYQAEQDFEAMRFNMRVDLSNAKWQTITVERFGASGAADPSKPFGSNRDVKFVKVYRDVNGNDELDSFDNLISGIETISVVEMSTSAALPFDLVVQSTSGWPTSGNIWVGEKELMMYSSFSVVGANGALQVIARAQRLGDNLTPVTRHPIGVKVEKVDIFNQADEGDLYTAIELTLPQLITRTIQTYFLTYDIHEEATVGNLIGLKISSAGAVGVARPHKVDSRIYVDVSRTQPDGSGTQNFPYSTSLASIGSIVLSVKGTNLAPAGVKPGMTEIAFTQLTLSVSKNYLDIGTIRVDQTGTVDSPQIGTEGQGDIEKLSVYVDADGNQTFTPDGDTNIGSVIHDGYAGGSSDFTGGVALVPLDHNSTGRLRVEATPVIIFIVGDISPNDTEGCPTMGIQADPSGPAGCSFLGHQVGLRINSISDILSPGAAQAVSVGEDPVYHLPVASNLSLITPEVIKAVNLIPAICYANDKYPAFAVKDSSGNIVRDSKGLVVPDLDNRISSSGEPLIDIDGDGDADNYDFNGDGRKDEVDIDGDNIPETDLDGDGVLDVDYNDDGIGDMVQSVGGGVPQVFLRNLEGSYIPVPDQGFAKSAWSNVTTEMYGAWGKVPNIRAYYVALGKDFLSTEGLAQWQQAGMNASKNLTGLALAVPKTTRLYADISPDDTAFYVEDGSVFPEQKMRFYIGSEIIQAQKVTGTSQFAIVTRGAVGSIAQHHLKGEVVSDDAVLYSVRAESDQGGAIIPNLLGRPLFMYRVDPSPPSVPGMPAVATGGTISGNSFQIDWNASSDDESRVLLYEIQEREDSNPVWKTIALIPARRPGGAVNNSFIVGDPNYPGENPRPSGRYYSYRVRSFNTAGAPSTWSVDSKPTASSEPPEVINKVSNYPNPVDTRKGGHTTIAYTLAQDSSVKITVYDLLGYKVREWSCSPGDPNGCRAGPNFMKWFGNTSGGRKVGKGGYIVRIEVNSPKGSQTITRKVGIIH
ncbi:fibronectin type III domain-containing protein [Elusimicrobiota bacterium]